MNSFIPWIGGKKLLRNKIISLFPPSFERYIEVFGGAGWVLFAKEKHAPFELYNDVDVNLVNLFRCVKYHRNELQKEIESLCLTSRELFQDFRAQLSCPGYTDIQRASRLYILIRISFGADYRSFGCSPKNVFDKIDYLTEIQQRLKNVLIENKDFESLIKQYDRENALFYCDPPYHTTEKMYNVSYTEADHVRLRDTLSNIKGRFILSYNNDDYIKQLYKDFEIIETDRNNNISNHNKRFKELIIKNY